MIDPMGGGGASDAARRAEEEARRRALEAARRAAEEARRVAAERATAAQRDQALAAVLPTPYSQAANVTTGATGSPGPTYSVHDAARLAAFAPDTGGAGPVPPGRDDVRVPVRPQADPASVTDDWIRESKAAIGMGSTAVYDAYMSRNRLGLDQMARILAPARAPSADAMLQAGDTEGYVNVLVRPALDAMADLHPEASFELLTVDHGALGDSMPGAHPIYAPQTVIRMTGNGAAQDYVLDASRLFRPTGDDRVHDAIVATPGGMEAWNDAMARFELDQGSPRATWDAVSGLPTDGADYNLTRGIMTMDAATQEAFLTQYGQGSDLPLGILRPVETVPADEILLTVDVDPLARGESPAAFSTVVHNPAVDGLAGSTALPPIGGMSQPDWRATLDRLATSPPATIGDLRAELTRISGGAITEAELEQLAAADGNALPALLSLVQDHPPAVSFDDTLHLGIRPGGRGVPATYESIAYDPLANVAVVDTTLNLLVRDPDEWARLASTYGVGDLPMTIRVPLPEGAPTDWDDPSPEQLALLNQQIRSIDSASVFLHGFQSDRRVWESDMQRWMELSPRPTIGIAFGGMGSEGDFVGSGESPLTARQYAFHTMEALDALGLYGKELNLYGHSMGGAAVLQIGLATDRMVAGGARRPEVNYVLLQPAPTGDSVPFLTEHVLSGVIDLQTNVGASGWLGNAVAQVTNWVGSGGVLNILTPGAPEYVQDVHEGFPTTGGFDQLKATALGLVLQAEPAPAEVHAFLRENHVLVVAGTQDRIVSTAAVRGVFDGQVFEVPGNHYAHLPSEIAEQNHFGAVEGRVREFLTGR